uniref:Importin N-terminal domain-containing protein n=1 Tax=Pinguiococcus pyrenoidosus TaxID=172671 RepID=A0A7R9YDQ3_9STRA|mmetsp:Transcript_3367/g.13439  ORF Transcript_3367/g.13439 Transcript_3367/m.13439 type:complete len:990 (+) Transcript_3367:215-3184(+)
MADAKSLLNAMEATLSPERSIRKAGEDFLLAAQQQPTHILQVAALLLSNLPPPVALAAAVYFKNVVKKHWEPEERLRSILQESDKEKVKENLVNLIVASTYEVQRPLTEALSIIAKLDFPLKWEGLLPGLVQKLRTASSRNDFRLIYGCLLIANEVFKRFRYAFKTEELMLQLEYCLDHFQEALLAIFHQCCHAVESAQNERSEVLVQLLETIRLCARIFYSLSYQDIPAFFETHLAEWAQPFEQFLAMELPVVKQANANSSKPDALERLQAAIIENVMHYADMYDAEFKDFLPGFAKRIWALLTTLSGEPRSDQLATKGINFLTKIISKQLHQALFQDEATLRSIVSHVVLPNILLRELEEELFEMSPTEFIQRDMEGSDADTRRRCARDLVRGMCVLYGRQTTQIVGEHIQTLLKEYQDSSEANWRSKDTALHLILAVTVKAESKKGVRAVNEAINVMEMLTSHVIPELQDPNPGARPLVKATAIKFANTFRGQMGVSELLSLLPLYIRHMSPNIPAVVQTYACISVEKMLTLRDPMASGAGKVPPLVIQRAQLGPYMESLTNGIFAVLANEEFAENDYVMKALMRVLAVAKEEIKPVYQVLTETLCQTLGRVWQNPSNPHFGHYLFECIAIVVSTITKTVPGSGASFERLLFPPFQAILQQDVEQLTPYVFQIMAQLLEASEAVSKAFWELLPILLTPATWSRKSNTPALVRFLVAYLKKAGGVIAEQGKLEAVLAIAQKLVSSRANESSAFQLLEMLVLHVSEQHVQKYLRPLLEVLLRRLEQNSSLKYIRLLSYFWCVVINKYGAAVWWSTLESIQNGLPVMLLQSVFLSNASRHKSWAPEELKCFCAGIVNILVQTNLFMLNQALWGQGMESMLLILQRDSGIEGDDEGDGTGSLGPTDVPEMTYDATYSRLVFADAEKRDPFPNIPPPTIYLPRCLAEFCAQSPDLVLQQLQVLSPELQAGLQQLCQSAGVTLSNRSVVPGQ